MTDATSIWESKLSRLQDLDDQLDQEREANRETRRIIAALTLRIPAIEAPSESPVASETVEEEPERAEPRSAAGGGSQEGTHRPWWRRGLGG